ncbi:MAG: transcriptional repressor LexA [Bryobacterales bacterium]
MALTKRQHEVLEFISQFLADNEYSPSFEEIAEGLGLASIATVHKHLTALESKGYLKRSFNQSRALELAPKYYKEQRVHRREAAMRETRGAQTPLLGVIAAGRPIETYEQPETLAFPEFAGAQNVYALQVRGESMIDDHIVEGDYVLVEQTDHVRNGEIVVALVDGSETTLKRFYHEADGTVRLQPANASMEPIRVAAAQVAIQGRVLAVHRRYR